MSTTLIEKYAIKYSSGNFPRSIILYSGIEEMGVLQFHANASTLPPDKEAGKLIVLNYRLEDFYNILCLLKTEKPVYLAYTGADRGDENGILTRDPDEPMQSEKNVRRKKEK
jgi:hypothetical protein